MLTPTDNSRVLRNCFFLAVAIETIILFLFGQAFFTSDHVLSSSVMITQPMEAQLYQEKAPSTSHLRSEHPTIASPLSSEPTLSKSPDVGKDVKPSELPVQPQNNQTVAVSPAPPLTHGPVSMASPSPIIPNYLLNNVLKTSVVIEFFISKEGRVVPTLLSSSENEELDQIALKAAKKWTFKPAQKEGVSIDSRLRLRIEFEVQ